MASSPKDNGKDKVTRFKEYVAALNKQFLDWCTSQIGAKPDKFLTTGITDYLRHNGKLRAQFADVIEEENNSKAGRDSTSYAPLLSLMPVANTKTLHFIRHGEGFHNIGYQTLDSHLTEKGWEQAHALGTHMAAFPSTSGVQLVIVSPMMRCLETAAGVFACDTNTNSPKVGGTKVLMEAQAGEALVRVAHDQIVTPAGLTFVSHELCRERLGA
jgi:phosphohistidine phosphatase SixA